MPHRSPAPRRPASAGRQSRPELEHESKATLAEIAAAVDSREAQDGNATVIAVRKILQDAKVPAAVGRASGAGFTCGLRLTCARCDFQVCGNPQHAEYNADPHAKMARHRNEAHGDGAAHV